MEQSHAARVSSLVSNVLRDATKFELLPGELLEHIAGYNHPPPPRFTFNVDDYGVLRVSLGGQIVYKIRLYFIRVFEGLRCISICPTPEYATAETIIRASILARNRADFHIKLGPPATKIAFSRGRFVIERGGSVFTFDPSYADAFADMMERAADVKRVCPEFTLEQTTHRDEGWDG